MTTVKSRKVRGMLNLMREIAKLRRALYAKQAVLLTKRDALNGGQLAELSREIKKEGLDVYTD